jgi:hypothetical protein
MTHYSRKWNCERCGREEESMDVPKVAVCEWCIGAEIVVTRQMKSGHELMLRVAEAAYVRGYRHGKKVATEEIMGVEDGT